MIPSTIEAIDHIHIIIEPIVVTKEDAVAIEVAFKNPSVIKYLKHLKADLYQDHVRIDLKTYFENKELYAAQQIFVKGGINVIETLLQIHKNQPT
jgi:hypothetical protein